MRSRIFGIVAIAAVVLGLSGLRVGVAQQQGGAFVPTFNYSIPGASGGPGGFWDWRHSGGVVGTNTGPAAFKINGTAVYEVAEAGVVALDGSNPTSVTMSPLAVIDGCTVTLKSSSAPGLDPYTFSVVTTATAGQLDIYAWKATSSGNPTLIASTSTALVQYSCTGR